LVYLVRLGHVTASGGQFTLGSDRTAELPTRVEAAEEIQGPVESRPALLVFAKQGVRYPPGPVRNGLVQPVTIAHGQGLQLLSVLPDSMDIVQMHGALGQQHEHIMVVGHRPAHDRLAGPGQPSFNFLRQKGELALCR
jgi:hypothetical protein